MVSRKVVVIILVTTFILGGAMGYAFARQPHMLAALNHLQDARIQLEKSSHNKGGHRAEAIKLTSLAIEEVKMGMEVGEGR